MNDSTGNIRTKDLVSELSCREGVDVITLGLEDEIEISCRDGDHETHEHAMYISGPAIVLVVTD